MRNEQKYYTLLICVSTYYRLVFSGFHHHRTVKVYNYVEYFVTAGTYFFNM